MDRQPDVASVADIEIGMRRQERLRLGGRRFRKTIDIMVAVALGVGDADQGAKREVLLHAKAGLTGQILAGDKESFVFGAPFRSTRGVDDRLVNPLAGFGGNPAIAE